MKPHVPANYAEDLQLLKDLAEDLMSHGDEYGFATHQVAETLEEVRLLLEREVDFRREQATLAEIMRVYPAVRAPKPIPELSTDTITAMSFERGVKVTDAIRNRPLRRRRVAARLVEDLLAAPIFSDQEEAVFHADPHAGNLLYDERTDELVILDWALTGRLTAHQRRQVARLISMMMFRDRCGVREAIQALSQPNPGSYTRDSAIIERQVREYFDAMPHVCSPGAVDAMRLLDGIGVEGVRFPASLVLIRKVVFTLDGVLRDIAGGDVQIDTIVAREFVSRWVKRFGWVPQPFRLSDYLALQRSALAYVSGFWAWPAA
jgi:ubiquinone biosynthesis protein